MTRGVCVSIAGVQPGPLGVSTPSARSDGRAPIGVGSTVGALACRPRPYRELGRAGSRWFFASWEAVFVGARRRAAYRGAGEPGAARAQRALDLYLGHFRTSPVRGGHDPAIH